MSPGWDPAPGSCLGVPVGDRHVPSGRGTHQGEARERPRGFLRPRTPGRSNRWSVGPPSRGTVRSPVKRDARALGAPARPGRGRTRSPSRLRSGAVLLRRTPVVPGRATLCQLVPRCDRGDCTLDCTLAWRGSGIAPKPRFPARTSRGKNGGPCRTRTEMHLVARARRRPPTPSRGVRQGAVERRLQRQRRRHPAGLRERRHHGARDLRRCGRHHRERDQAGPWPQIVAPAAPATTAASSASLRPGTRRRR
jgi:hypothetical protein